MHKMLQSGYIILSKVNIILGKIIYFNGIIGVDNF